MWFGTRDGLNRYDSYEFSQFKYQAEDSNSISNNTISSLLEDQQGIIWIGTEGGGLNSYHQKSGKFSRYMHDPGQTTSIPNNYVSAIAEADDGNLWLGTRSGLSLFNARQGVVQHFNIPIEPEENKEIIAVNDIWKDAEGLLWLATEGAGLVRFDTVQAEFKPFRHDSNDSSSIGADIVNNILEDRQGRLWLGSWGFGMNQFDKKTEKFVHYLSQPDVPNGLPSNNIFAITEDYTGNLWVGTRNGLSLFDPVNQTYTTYDMIPGNSYSLTDNVGFSLYNDTRDQILWVGTWGNGVNILDQYGRQTVHIQQNPENPHWLNDNDLFALFEDQQGILWIGSEGGGLTRYDRGNDSFKSYLHDPDDPTSISSDEVVCIHQDRKGLLWIGTYGGGLNQFDPETEVFTLYKGTAEQPFTNLTIISIYEDSRGLIWVTTAHEGVISIDPNSGKYNYYGNPNEADSRISNDILSIFEDQQQHLWFGSTNSGIALLDPSAEDFTYFKHDAADSNSLGANAIYAFHQDTNGALWIGTRGSGLNVLQLPLQEQVQFSTIDAEQGLISDWIFGIKEDSEGNIWASGYGLSRIDGETKQIVNYSFTESNQGAFHRSKRTGHFFLGYPEGLDIFHPDSIPSERRDTPVLITNLKRYNETEQSGKAIEVPGIFTNDSILLSYQDQILAFEFLNLSYDVQQAREYVYLLENFNEDWIQIDTERKITFTGLAPGDYRLRVKSVNPSGALSTNEASLFITILPPWWQSNLAKMIYMILSISSLVGFYYWRSSEHRRKIRQKEMELQQERELNDRLKQVDKLKDHFLANTSHELRTPLQGIIGMSESLLEQVADKSQQDDLGLIISSGRRLNNLVNDILDFSKLRNQELLLHLKPVDIKAAAHVVLTLSRPLIKNKSITLVNGIPHDCPLVQADENRLQQILHNLIGNAIKFTERGEISITCKEKKGMLAVAIQDQGVGIPPEKLEVIFNSFEQLEDSLTREHGGTGLGLTVTKQLVELHGGKIMVTSEPGVGSTFEFTLPLSKSKRNAKVDTSIEITDTIIETPEVVTGTVNPQTNGTDKIKILVVDDEPVNLKVIENHLKQVGYDVTLASDGPQALSLIADGQIFDLVILDVMMPKMSGFEVCQKLRVNFMPSELPVILLTAKNAISDLMEGFNAGANDYITKPFSKDELLSRLKTHLNLHRINRATAKFIPSEFLQILGRDSITEIQLGDHTVKNVTVFFSDIRDYTTLAEHMSPEENFKFINSYVGKMGPVIKENQGFVNQYLGDGIMAIFPDSFEEALKAAIGMQQAIQQYNIRRHQRKRKPLMAGMGMHLGPLVMGIIGDTERNEPSLIADTVNTASRMEGLTKYYGANIVLSEDCLYALRDKEAYHFRYLGQVQVKGKNQVMKAYECVDGDEEVIKLAKIKTLKQYQDGLELFYKKDFPEATGVFGKILKINPEDKVAQHFRNLSARYTHEGVPTDWSGIEKIDSK